MNAAKSIKQIFSRFALAMAVFLLTLSPAPAFTSAAHGATSENRAAAAFDPTAVFKRCWVDYNVMEDGRRGMRIHVDFEVTGLKGVDSKIVARVAQENGDFLASTSAYSNSEGELETSYSIKPGFPTTEYEDAQMFLPYSEIALRKGVWNLKLDIDLSYEDGGLIQHLGYKHFQFTAPNLAADANGNGNGGNDGADADVSAKVNRVWVERGIYRNRQRGMLVHINFEVTGLKDVDSKVTVRVRREDDSLLTSTSSYSNDAGELELAYEIQPGFETTVYKDATVFLPYSELNVRKGNWNLRLDIDLNYDNGELISHLAYHEFEFTK